MARPRTPTNLLTLRGVNRKNPGRIRARANEPTPTDSIGDPPAGLSPAQAGAWAELVSSAYPGVLSASDRLIVEIGARLLVEFREGERPDPRLALRIESILGRIGLTPADRSRVVARPPPVENAWLEFLRPPGGVAAKK